MKDRNKMAAALILLLGTVSLASGCSLTGGSNQDELPGLSGKFMVNSVEEGSVAVDGTVMGETNQPISGVEPGKHTITVISPEGMELFKDEALIPGDGDLTLRVEPEMFMDSPTGMDTLSGTAESLIPEEAVPDTDEDLGQTIDTGTKAIQVPVPQNTVQTIAITDGTRYETPMYIIDSGVKGPTVWIIGGVHGNEPAGYKAADTVKGYSAVKGRLIVLPRANKLAIAANNRYVSSTGDLNRAFPTSNGYSAKGTLAKGIQAQLRKYKPDYLMDLHEGYDYTTSRSTDSVGQSIIYYPKGSAYKIAGKIANALNPTIAGTYKDFKILKYPVPGSIARYAGSGFDVPTLIFETASKVSLDTRVGYQLKAVNTMLQYLGMK